MSMCYLCDMCKHQIELRKWDRSIVHVCAVTDRAEMVAIDYGRDDPEWVPDIAASVSCRDYERAEEGE